MKEERVLFKRWSARYLSQLAFSLLGLGGILLAGEFYCRKIHPVWYEGDPKYALLNFVDDNKTVVVLFLLSCLSILLAIYHLKKIADGIMEITQAIDQLYASREDTIVLPKEFQNLEGQLKQIQFDMKVSRQAAQEANQRKNDMIMYMAHDLKTPLTSVIGYLSLLNEEKEIPEHAREKYIDIALKKSLRLEELINEFFEITRFNFTHMILEKSNVNMSMMLSQILVEFEHVFAEKKLEYHLHMDEDVQVMCDVDKMERVFDNLLKNIANYSYPESDIFIVLNANGKGGMKLLTQNRGKTIPKEMQEHIFDQFFRMDSSRKSSTGGTGLGLAVTKEIINLHGGTIRCESEDEKILFEVVLPGL